MVEIGPARVLSTLSGSGSIAAKPLLQWSQTIFHGDAQPMEIDTCGQMLTGSEFSEGLISAIVVLLGSRSSATSTPPCDMTEKTSRRADFIGRYKSRSTSANEMGVTVE